MDATVVIAAGKSRSRDGLELRFSQCGFQVETACDGLECLAKVGALEPEVLVVDWELAWGGAAGVVAFLNETCFEIEMPVVLVVGNAPAAVLSQWTGVPESSCFRKPVRTESLLDWVGLAMALIDLRRNREPPPRRRGLGRPGETETCLV
jgi:FixJ family two-component response regulator